MIEIKEKKVQLSTLKVNPDNPRTITGKEMDKLVKSLQEFPEMMQLREIVVDENNIILGGNMRYLALKKSGAGDCMAKIVSGLSDAKKREFIIRDNANYGEWSMDDLANSWSDLPLAEWGIDLLEDWLNSDKDIEGQQDPQEDELEGPQIIICPKCNHEFSVLKEKL